jgi:hypothetical protein
MTTLFQSVRGEPKKKFLLRAAAGVAAANVNRRTNRMRTLDVAVKTFQPRLETFDGVVSLWIAC